MSSPSFSEKKSQELNTAARKGNLRLVKSLSLDPEVDLNWQDSTGCTPFYSACEKGHVDIVRYLLDFHDNHQRRTIDFNLADDNGSTPFSCVCFDGDEEMVEMLVGDERIDLIRADRSGRTPLYCASYYGWEEVVKILLASTGHFDTEKKDVEGKTAADVARERGAEIQMEWETEEVFQQRKRRCQLTVTLIESYEKDPQGVRGQLRRELGIAGEEDKFDSFLSL